MSKLSKKTIPIIVIAVLLVVTGAVLLGVYFLSPKSDPKYVAHRGYSREHLGNTEEAFKAASEMPFYGVETDIRKTRDGVFVCNHDETVKFRDGEERAVSSATYAELISKPLLNDKDDEEVYLCSFRRYLEICKSGGKVAVIELKEDFSQTDLLALLAEVDTFYNRQSVSVISFYFDALLRVREIAPSVPLQYLSETKKDPLFDRCFKEKISIDVRQTVLTAKMVKAFHKEGLTVNVWTVNKEFDRSVVRIKGVDYITTDLFTEEKDS